MKIVCLIILLGFSACGCARQAVSPAAEPAQSTQRHELDWERYDGKSDKSRAVYLLDGQRLGQGQVGLEELRRRIAQMPSGSQLRVMPYYSGEQTPKDEYPFDLSELGNWAKQYGVTLEIPMAG